MKRCTKCGREQPLDNFYAHSMGADGKRAACIPCELARNAAWRAANRDRHQVVRKAWRDANPDRQREATRAWTEANRERHLARTLAWNRANVETQRVAIQAWRHANPAKLRLYASTRRARMMDAFVEEVHPLVVLEMDDGICGICGHDVDPQDFQVDHIVPLARGGEHSYGNSQVAHSSCNMRKGARPPWEMAA
jgi:hypothetical protein